MIDVLRCWLFSWGCVLQLATVQAQGVTHELLEVDGQGTHWFRTSPSSHKIPKGVPGLAIHLTERAERSPEVHVVVYFHGWRGCPRVLLSPTPVPCRDGGPEEQPFALRHAVEEAKLPVVFVVPQLSFWKRSGAAGRFRDPTYAKGWFASLGDTEALKGKRVRSTTLVAHSAGFETVLCILAGTPDVAAQVVMLDALYDGGAALANWLLGDEARRVLTLTLRRGDTFKQSRVAERLVRKHLGASAVGRPALDGWAEGVRFKNVRASTNHRDIPRKQLAGILRLLLLKRGG